MKTPTIRINKQNEVTYFTYECVTDDDSWAALIAMGKKEATEEDYASIAIQAALANYLTTAKEPPVEKDYQYELTLAKLYDDGFPTIPHEN